MIHNDRMDGSRNTPLRNMARPMGFYRGLPEIYPIFIRFLPEDTEQLCAGQYTFSHTLEDQEASYPLFYHINHGVEPRASLSGTRLTHG